MMPTQQGTAAAAGELGGTTAWPISGLTERQRRDLDEFLAAYRGGKLCPPPSFNHQPPDPPRHLIK